MASEEQGKQKETSKETPPEKQGAKGQEKGSEEKTADKVLMSHEEIEKKIQSETDKRVQQAVKSTLEKAEQQKAQELETQKKAAEQERLKEEGQFQKLFEESQSKLDALTGEISARTLRDDCTSALKKLGLQDFADILLTPKKTVAEAELSAAQIREMMDKEIKIEVAKLLDTGKRPIHSAPTEEKQYGDMTPEEWAAKKKELRVQV